MSLVTMDADGFRQVIEALRSGEPVVLPPPSPITYGLAATTAAAVNEAKGRPPGQCSGNTSRGNPAWTAREADEAFGGRLLVPDGDALTAGGDARAYLEDLTGRASTYGDEKEA